MSGKRNKWLRSVLNGCAFDDFLNPPGWGVVESRGGISLTSRFSTNVKLNIPIVSANMDTVTGARMAIAIAKQGGLGVIHRYLNIEDQCVKIREVKRAESFVIKEPYEINPGASVGEARDLMQKNKVGGLVVVDQNKRLVGMLSGRDVRFCGDDARVVKRMTPIDNLKYGFLSTTLEEAKKIIDTHRLEKLPLIDKGTGRLLGLITAKDIESIERHPLANKDEKGQLVVGAAIGATGDYLERAAELIRTDADVIVLDIANAQSVVGEKAVREFRKRFPDFELVVGNIVLSGAVKKYQTLGANGLKVGLGPGSACTTRKNTNIGVPQAQAIFECSVDAEIPICADGGVKRNGHFGLALLLGADSVMAGGTFAGTDETPGLVFRNSEGRKVKRFRGMASREAMYEKLRAEEADDPYEISSRISPEGMEKEVEYRGPVVPIVKEIVGHLSSMVSYLGARNLKEAKGIFMADPARYLVKLSEAAKKESFER